MYVLESALKQNDDGLYSKLGFIMGIITDELAEELKELDETQTRLFMYQIGEVISWIGHGDNDRLPDAIRSYADVIQPSAKPSEAADTHLGIDS